MTLAQICTHFGTGEAMVRFRCNITGVQIDYEGNQRLEGDHADTE